MPSWGVNDDSGILAELSLAAVMCSRARLCDVHVVFLLSDVLVASAKDGARGLIHNKRALAEQKARSIACLQQLVLLVNGFLASSLVLLLASLVCCVLSVVS